jgi:hypothetical protein
MTQPMQALILSLVVLVIFTHTPGANSAESPAKKSKFNTQIYEKEDPLETFQDSVKMVRDMAGESQVIFKSRPGFFIIEDSNSGATFKNQLMKAQKTNRELSITINKESRTVKDVSEKD